MDFADEDIEGRAADKAAHQNATNTTTGGGGCGVGPDPDPGGSPTSIFIFLLFPLLLLGTSTLIFYMNLSTFYL